MCCRAPPALFLSHHFLDLKKLQELLIPIEKVPGEILQQEAYFFLMCVLFLFVPC